MKAIQGNLNKSNDIPCSQIRRQYFQDINTPQINLHIEHNLYENPS